MMNALLQKFKEQATESDDWIREGVLSESKFAELIVTDLLNEIYGLDGMQQENELLRTMSEASIQKFKARYGF